MTEKKLSNFEKVQEFQAKRGENPTFPLYMPEKDVMIWLRLLSEETTELHEALVEKDMIKLADALADILYIVYGFGGRCGLPMDAVFDAVHRSNMTKTLESVNGKITKGEDYEPPQIEEALVKALQDRLQKEGWQ